MFAAPVGKMHNALSLAEWHVKKISSCADENEKRPRKNTKDIKPYNIEQEQNLLENAVKIHRRTFPAVSSPALLRGTLGLYPIYIYIYIYIYIQVHMVCLRGPNVCA